MNDEWLHFALIAEFDVPILNGWLALTYGTDAGRDGETDSKFSFSYAYYMNRILSK